MMLAAFDPSETHIWVRIDGVDANISAGQPPESVEIGDGRATVSMDATGSAMTVVRDAVRFAGSPTAANEAGEAFEPLVASIVSPTAPPSSTV